MDIETTEVLVGEVKQLFLLEMPWEERESLIKEILGRVRLR